MAEKYIRPVVIGIIAKLIGGQHPVIMTQWRKVLDPTYDPLYDQTWECVGETLKPGESAVDSLIRGIQEECGVAIDRSWIMDDGLHSTEKGKEPFTTRKDEKVHTYVPYALVQSVGEPQLWMGPVFIVRVPEDWEPNYAQGDGEATKHKWWDPYDLVKEMQDHPEHFMGLHAPTLERFARLNRLS